MGYGLYSINELILTEAQDVLAVASSNFFARSIPFAYKWEENSWCSLCSFSRNKFMMYVSKILTTSGVCVRVGGNVARVARNPECVDPKYVCIFRRERERTELADSTYWTGIRDSTGGTMLYEGRLRRA